MEKILLVGKYCEDVKKLNKDLSEFYNVQLCVDSLEMLGGVLKIIKPNLVLVYIKDSEAIDSEILDYLLDVCDDTPVMLIGDMETRNKFYHYMEFFRFAFLAKPIHKEELLEKCQDLIYTEQISNTDRDFDKTGQKNILIVDDSALTLRSVRALLHDKYQVSVATSGEQALKVIKKSKPDLILLDYEMPGWDGKKTLEMIRADEMMSDIPVVFLTSVADKDYIAAVLGLNPAGYFLKPPKSKKLLEAIENILQHNG